MAIYSSYLIVVKGSKQRPTDARALYRDLLIPPMVFGKPSLMRLRLTTPRNHPIDSLRLASGAAGAVSPRPRGPCVKPPKASDSLFHWARPILVACQKLEAVIN